MVMAERRLVNWGRFNPVLKFCLGRLAQLGNDDAVEQVFNHVDLLRPVFSEVVNYIKNLRYLDDAHRSQLGGRLLDLLDGSIVSALPYHRMWILDVFGHSTEWDNESRFMGLYNEESDQACRRKLILAMGRAQQVHWFQSQWRSLFDHPHWQRRAVLAAASCMPGDARKHWYRSVEPQLDPLEKSVVRWARHYPFEIQVSQ